MRIHQLAQTTIAQGALTNSKRASGLVEGVYPTHLKRGHNCHVWDLEDNLYVDYICGLGTNLVGYGRKEIINAVVDQMENGTVLSLSSEIETLFAMEFIEAFGYHQKIKIFKTGTEGCMAAVKIGLAHTKRKLIVKDGYHGWSNLLICREPPACGVPDVLKQIVFKRDEAFNWDDVGCYILEPVVTEWNQDRIDYLHCLREKCTKHGVVLIFDETITALRFPERSVAHQIGIEPDISVMGKALGGGLPISVVAGRAEIMDNPDYFVSGTWCGDMAAIGAARATLKICDKNQLKELWEEGERFVERFNEVCEGIVRLNGYPTRGVLTGHTDKRTMFMQECCKAGILFGPSWFFNVFHYRETDHVINLCKEVCNRIKKGHVKLEGKVPRSAFSQEVRSASR